MRIIKLTEVIRLTSLSRSNIYRRMPEGTFPSSIPLGGNKVGWSEDEVLNWILDRIAERDESLDRQ